MYKVAENLIPIACGLESRNISVKIQIDEGVFDDSSILDFILENSITTNDDIELGGCVASRFNVRLRTDHRFTKQQKVLVWIKTSNQNDENTTTDFVPMGEFYIHEIVNIQIPKSSICIVTLNCFDKFAEMNKPYQSAIVYPTTIGKMLAELSEKFTLALDAAGLNSANLSFYIKDKPENAVCRDVLRWIASLNGGFFVITREGKLKFELYDKTPTTDKVKLREDKFFELPKKSSQHKLIKKIVYNQDTELEPIGVGAPVSIEQTLFTYNPFINTPQAEKAYNAVQGIQYKPMIISCPGHILVDVGDTVAVVTSDGSEEQIVVLRHTLSYKGGLKSVIEAPSNNIPVVEQKQIGLSQSIKDLNQRMGVFLQHINPEKIIVKKSLQQIASIPIKTRSRTDLEFTNTMLINASAGCIAEFAMESEGNVIRHPWPIPLNKGLNLVSFTTTEKDLPTIQGYINYKMSSGQSGDSVLEIEPQKAEFTIYGGSIVAGSDIPVLDFRDVLDTKFDHALQDALRVVKPHDHKRNQADDLNIVLVQTFNDVEEVNITKE